MILRRRNIPYIAGFAVAAAFFGWIVSNMAEQTQGHGAAYMAAGMGLFLAALVGSARAFMGRTHVVCPECDEEVERGRQECPNCGHELPEA